MSIDFLVSLSLLMGVKMVSVCVCVSVLCVSVAFLVSLSLLIGVKRVSRERCRERHTKRERERSRESETGRERCAQCRSVRGGKNRRIDNLPRELL